MGKMNDWIEIGNYLKRVHEKIIKESLKYRSSSKEARALMKAEKYDIKLRSTLDDLIFILYPNINSEVLAHIFYGEEILQKELDDLRKKYGPLDS